MNKEYWKIVLLGKPRGWFYVTIVLFITSAVMLVVNWKSGRMVAMTAMLFAMMGLLGWTKPPVPELDFPQIERRRRPWFACMVLLLAAPVISFCIESYRDSKGHKENNSKTAVNVHSEAAHTPPP